MLSTILGSLTQPVVALVWAMGKECINANAVRKISNQKNSA